MLRLLSFNIQAGAAVQGYRHYLTRGWQHVLPHRDKRRNLDRVAELVARYDMVALQEADAPSLRSGFENQVQYLAETARFPYWSHQANRRVARVAEPGNGLLSRIEPSAIWDHRLPGAIPGRGALEAVFGPADAGLHVFVAHLALGKRARRAQFDYLAEIIGSRRHVVLMGDLNCEPGGGELEPLFARTELRPPDLVVHTFPSWDPRRGIDHILVSRALLPLALEVPVLRVSDHLPVALSVELPEACTLRGSAQHG